jgi:hypothetical protein
MTPQNITAAYILIFGTSLIYDRIIANLDQDGQLYGLRSLLWLGGTAYTLIIVSVLVVRMDEALLVAGAFVFMLGPLMFGDIKRFIEARRKEARFWKNLIPNGDDYEQENLG